MLRLQGKGEIRARLALENRLWRQHLRWADVVVFCRNLEPAHVPILDVLHDANIPYVFDIDDNFLDVPEKFEIAKYLRHPRRRETHIRYISEADVVRVYSPAMVEVLSTYSDRVELVRAPTSLEPIETPSAGPRPEVTRIVFPTTTLGHHAARLFLPALRRILDEYPGAVEAHFWGFAPSELAQHQAVFYRTWDPNYGRFLRAFSAERFDIGLAPMSNAIFDRCKSDQKLRLFGACGVAGIYSDVDVYSSCVAHGETGLLVRNDESDWYHAIRLLIDDPALRKKIARQATDYVRQNRSEAEFDARWLGQIREVLEARGPRRPVTSTMLARLRSRPRRTFVKVRWLAFRALRGPARKEFLRRFANWSKSERVLWWNVARLTQQRVRGPFRSTVQANFGSDRRQ